MNEDKVTTININNIPEYNQRIHVSDINQAIWHTLSEYSNEAFACRFIEGNYKIKNFGNRNYKKQAMLFSFSVRQGIEYLRSSLSSSLATRPLLLYYGIMNLAKSLIVYNNPNYLTALKKDTNRKHGLSYRGSESKKYLVCNDKVYIKAPGTFNFFQEALHFPNVQGNQELTLKRLLSWMVDTSPIETDVYIPGKRFEQYLENIPVKTKVKLCKEIKTKNRKKYGSYFLKVTMPVRELNISNIKRDIKKIIPELKGFNIRHLDTKSVVLDSKKYEFDFKKDLDEITALYELLWKLDTISYFNGYSSYFFQRMKGEELLAQPYVYYLISFILGSVCRYEPNKWVKIIEAKETNEKWIVELAMNVITYKFPLFVISYFRRSDSFYTQFSLM